MRVTVKTGYLFPRTSHRLETPYSRCWTNTKVHIRNILRLLFHFSKAASFFTKANMYVVNVKVILKWRWSNSSHHQPVARRRRNRRPCCSQHPCLAASSSTSSARYILWHLVKCWSTDLRTWYLQYKQEIYFLDIFGTHTTSSTNICHGKSITVYKNWICILLKLFPSRLHLKQYTHHRQSCSELHTSVFPVLLRFPHQLLSLEPPETDPDCPWTQNSLNNLLIWCKWTCDYSRWIARCQELGTTLWLDCDTHTPYVSCLAHTKASKTLALSCFTIL